MLYSGARRRPNRPLKRIVAFGAPGGEVRERDGHAGATFGGRVPGRMKCNSIPRRYADIKSTRNEFRALIDNCFLRDRAALEHALLMEENHGATSKEGPVGGEV